MKNILIVLTVLAMASVANAGLLISVDGVVDPPDTSISIRPSDVVVIDIYSDGTTDVGVYFLEVQGLASYDLSGAINNVNPDPPNPIDTTIFELYPGMIFIDLLIPSAPPLPKIEEGKAVDGIKIHCEGEPGDVTLTLWNEAMDFVYDTQVIHQIPEPITFALLGLGGLFLRRRK